MRCEFNPIMVIDHSAQKNMPQLIPKMSYQGYSSVLHCTSCKAHKNRLIGGMSMGAF